MWAVWCKNAIDEDTSLLSDLTAAQADRLVANVKRAFPDTPVWMEEE